MLGCGIGFDVVGACTTLLIETIGQCNGFSVLNARCNVVLAGVAFSRHSNRRGRRASTVIRVQISAFH